MTEGKPCCTPTSTRTSESRMPEHLSPAADALQMSGDMVSLPGGRFLMGTDYEGGFPGDGEGPVRPVVLSPFMMDVAPVTNAEFHAFVRATNHITDAERYGWSFVFIGDIPRERAAELVHDTVAQAPWWCQVFGTTWDAPEGPGSAIEARLDHPVVHVSWNDAMAYASWRGKQLPTEAEWEYAARGGLVQKLFAWGDELLPDGKHMCNIWQGAFPSLNTLEDGYAGTCPVRAFPSNGYGLYSVVGNTWEWTADWFGTSHPAYEATNPVGPAHGPGKAMKGGSFLCHASYCNRYRVAARTMNTPDSSTSNVGFRCVRRME